MRVAVLLCLLAIAAVGCGREAPIVEPLGADGEVAAGGDVLSGCSPASPGETTTLVAADGPRPDVATMEAGVLDGMDGEFLLAELEDGGMAYEDALHVVYAQVVGQELFEVATSLPGYVDGAYAQPEEGTPFRLSFSGDVPDELDPDAFGLGSYGLEVTTGAAGFDDEAFSAAIDAVEAAGMQLVSGSGDATAGTGRIVVVAATPEQVAAWEAAVADPDRWCLVLAPRTAECDDDVAAAARLRGERVGEPLPAAEDTFTDDEQVTAERAEEVRRSYLGLTEEEALDKAAAEQRAFRVVVQDGVALPTNDDLDPSRLNASVCRDVVVDVRFDLEG